MASASQLANGLVMDGSKTSFDWVAFDNLLLLCHTFLNAHHDESWLSSVGKGLTVAAS